MKTKVELITPDIAMAMLERNTHNRPISESTVACYAMDMRNNRWTLNHQGIAVDVDGTIQDGQHRLWAVVESGMSIEFNVSRDCPVTQIINGNELFTMDAIDRQWVRSTGQQMGLSHGIKNGNVFAAACRAIASMANATLANRRLSTATSMAIMDLYRADIESIIGALPTPYLRTSYIVGPMSVYHHGEPAKAVEIARQLFSLENMSPAIRTFRRHLEGGGISTRARHGKNIKVMARCILAFHNNENMKRITETDEGVDFLMGMFPSITKKIREALTPCRINVSRIRKSNKAQVRA